MKSNLWSSWPCLYAKELLDWLGIAKFPIEPEVLESRACWYCSMTGVIKWLIL